MKTNLLQRIAAALCITVLPWTAVSAAYPEQPIRLVVPTGAGGITDLLARVLAERLSPILEQSIVVENRAGASGVIGTSQVVRARPDGYTLLMVFPSHVANPSTIQELPYDTVNDLEPIAKVGKVVELLVVNPSGEFKTPNDIIEAGRKDPERLNYGSVGAGSLGHLATVVFADQSKVDMTNVSFKSEPEVLASLLRGDLDFTFVSPPAGLPMISGGQLKALAHSDSEPFPMLPGVPSVAQAADLPGYKVIGWNAIYAPKGTPPDIVQTLNSAINQALKDPELIERFLQLGVPPLGGTPEELRQSTIDDIEHVRSTLQAIGFKPGS